LFVALDVGDELRTEAARARAAIEAELRRTCRELPRILWVSPASLHLTLCFLGEVDDADVPSIERAMAPPFPLSPFDVKWRGLGAFPGPRDPRTLWIGVAHGADLLGALQTEVFRRVSGSDASRADAGGALHSFDGDTRPFRPHVTLGRVKSRGHAADWPAAIQAAEIRSARARIEHVTLFRSTLTPRGPAYTAMVRASLVGAR
jgi:2'-5' RNA ligase